MKTKLTQEAVNKLASVLINFDSMKDSTWKLDYEWQYWFRVNMELLGDVAEEIIKYRRR